MLCGNRYLPSKYRAKGDEPTRYGDETMRVLETARLTLRPFAERDFDAVHAYASDAANVQYLLWGPNDEAQTRAFLTHAIDKSQEKNPCTDYQFAVEQRTSGILIGACNLSINADEAEIGWILHRNYWRQGFGTEIANRLLKFGFAELGLHRLTAHCDAENLGSQRLMDRIGMRREGCFLEGRPANKFSNQKYGDEYSYAILSAEWKALSPLKRQ
jgi:RimJ/RimL family protein N-acetyltransferase